MVNSRACVAAALILLASVGSGQAEPLRLPSSQRDLSVTIYTSNLAFFADARAVTLQQGETILEIEGISKNLIPESLFVEGKGFHVQEQSFRPANLTPAALLRASVGENVRVEIAAEGDDSDIRIVEGELLSVDGGALVRIGEEVRIVAADRVLFPGVPDALDANDLLEVRLDTQNAGAGDAVIGYLAQGFSWTADYVAKLDNNEEHLAIVAKATLRNDTDESYEHAHVSLVAGDISRVRPQAAMPVKAQFEMMSGDASAGMRAAMPQQETAGEYHRYVLPTRVSLPAGTVKQVVFLEANSVAVTKRYRIENLLRAQTTQGDKLGPVNASVDMLLKNERSEGLGRPLPAGVWRVYGESPEGGALLLGESSQDHLAENGEATLTLGAAFDITAEAVTNDYKQVSNRSFETEQTVTVKNAKNEAVQVELVGDYPPNTRVLKETQAHEAVSATRLLWNLQVPPKGESVLVYRVLVSY